MASFASRLRQRGTVAATFETTTVADNQNDDESHAELTMTEQFFERAGITDNDVLRETPTWDGMWIDLDVKSTRLSVQAALNAGASDAWNVPHPSSASDILTRVRLPRTWSWLRNFGTRFQVVAGAATAGLLVSLGFVVAKTYGYDNAFDIVASTVRNGLGL
ncbi:MAG: hypothetical protein CMP20_01525 [Rickettsiales bacterium]|nr:hypothetical protein [Rickettsiales bacterium]